MSQRARSGSGGVTGHRGCPVQRLIVAAVLTLVSVVPVSAAGPPEVDFAREVQPLLARRCYSCHGPETREAGLRLDDRAAATARLASGGKAIVPGDPSASELLARVGSADPDTRMPPHGAALTAGEITTLDRWIAAGAAWKPHWAFQRPQRPPLPAPAAVTAPSVNPRPADAIDAFIDAGLTARGLPAPAQADKATLIRRASYAVTGLPPSADDVRAFLADDAADAWERVVDRLLASPHYGEHWARHWLDVVRYADTNSFERDGAKPHAWRYRDYVIRAFNDDKPYDQFVVEQLAGDELPDPSADALVATGYYRLGIWDDEPADKLQARYDGLDDIVSTTGQTFLGLTIGCARCHDHKIDPLTLRDYYGLLAIVHNVTPYGDRIERPLPAGSQTVAEAEHAAVEIDRRVAEAKAAIAAIDKRIEEHGEQALDDQARRERDSWETALAELEADRGRTAKGLVVAEHGREAPQTHIFHRGNPHAEKKPENLVAPAFPQVLAPPAPVIRPPASGGSTGRRMALADWIASADNPLTARVIVNRIWQHHFGRGIVRSPSNFGLRGDPPTHPELLDWLATEFVARGWRMKRLHKLILTSRAFRASSRGVPTAQSRDPLNDGLWRFDMRRLAAEELRDTIHVVSGAFNPKMYGPGVYPAMPQAVLATQSRPGDGWGKSPPEEQARRSVYIHVKRSLLTPLLADFDRADTDASCPVRFVTTQPTQALGMMNGDFLHAQARVFAARIRREAGAGAEDRTADVVRRAIEVALVRPASDDEMRRGVALIADLAARDGVGPQRALELYCLMILNLNEFAYLD